MQTGLLAALFVVSASLTATAQETPRLTGQNEAEEASVSINELNTDDYPDVRIFATVLKDGAPLAGLGAEDFRVREDEVDQEPLTVEPKLPPLSVVVTLDSSGSMSKRMTETQSAAKTFVASLGERDSVQLVSFAREIETRTPMTTTRDQIRTAIDAIAARGDTALYDALHHSIDLLAERRGRKAVVLLSDGIDDDGTGQPLSKHTIDDVLARADEVNLPVFVIGLGTEMDEAVLSDIAETTGARYLNAPDTSQLESVYAEISDQLSGQYAIRYTSNLPADGAARRVDLAALGQQDSRSYTPEGSEPASPTALAPVTSSCAFMEALGDEQPKLEQALARYTEGLISSADRSMLRSAAVSRLRETVSPAEVDLICAERSLQAVSDLYKRNLITSADRSTLRGAFSQRLVLTCGNRDTREGQVECLTFARDAYKANMITSADRSQLRSQTFEALLESMVQTINFDEDVALIGRLYEDNLISSADRRQARSRLLAAEN